ncbi:LOW QUALITY PROTEIN: uncharacterized protein LOC142594728 [Pelecanus crispus]|uniref:LOW QUALITY PROTEIN: uncharacterized protein LOC142594728 n=1 Tax=Pelecanus crispus TaxID=36300 RepID=UPI003F5D1420
MGQASLSQRHFPSLCWHGQQRGQLSQWLGALGRCPGCWAAPCHAPQEGAGQDRTARSQGLDPALFHRSVALEAAWPWGAGEDPLLGLQWPRTHWGPLPGSSVGMLQHRDVGAPTAWSCRGRGRHRRTRARTTVTSGQGPGLLSHPRAQLHVGLARQQSPSLWAVAVSRTTLCPVNAPARPENNFGLFSEAFGDTPFALPRSSEAGAGSCQAPTQLQPCVWLTRRRGAGLPTPRHPTPARGTGSGKPAWC